MKNNLINYFMTVYCSFFICFSSSIFVAAQNLNKLPFESKDFGSSLKKINKKKPEQNKSRKENNPNATATAEDEVLRVDTVMVLNEILVLDRNGNHITGLKKEDFVVKEDNGLQEIPTFLPGDSELIPRSIVLIIDYSGSQLPYIETSIEAAKVLVDKLAPKDQMAIVTDNIELLQSFTTDKTLLKNKLESLKISALSGQTRNIKQYSALMAALNEIFDDKTLRPIIVLQTDGDQLSALKVEANESQFQNVDEVNFSYKDLLTASEKTRATIYTIISGISFNETPEKERLLKAKTDLLNIERVYAKLRNTPFTPEKLKISKSLLESRAEMITHQQKAMAEIAKFTGGSTKYLEEANQADQIYSEIFSEMNLRYIIGYYPTNQERDGKSRTVLTEVRGHPEYKILGRKTYILAGGENKTF